MGAALNGTITSPRICVMQDKLATLGSSVDITKYVGGGLVVYDLHTRLMKWQTHLDLSTDQTTFRAHIFSSPTVVDLEGDGSMEILIGTSMVRPLP